MFCSQIPSNSTPKKAVLDFKSSTFYQSSFLNGVDSEKVPFVMEDGCATQSSSQQPQYGYTADQISRASCIINQTTVSAGTQTDETGEAVLHGLERFLHLNNSELLQLAGFFVAIPIAIDMVAHTKINGVLPHIGTSKDFSNALYKTLAPILISGAFVASLGRFGEAIDLFTNKKTFFDFVRYLRQRQRETASPVDNATSQKKQIVKYFFNILQTKNNRELGQLFGTIAGIGIAIYAIPFISEAASSNLAFAPKESNFKLLHLHDDLLLKILAIPLVSGILGAFIGILCGPLDLITNKKTIVDLVKYFVEWIKTHQNTRPTQLETELQNVVFDTGNASSNHMLQVD